MEELSRISAPGLPKRRASCLSPASLRRPPGPPRRRPRRASARLTPSSSEGRALPALRGCALARSLVGDWLWFTRSGVCCVASVSRETWARTGRLQYGPQDCGTFGEILLARSRRFSLVRCDRQTDAVVVANVGQARMRTDAAHQAARRFTWNRAWGCHRHRQGTRLGSGACPRRSARRGRRRPRIMIPAGPGGRASLIGT